MLDGQDLLYYVLPLLIIPRFMRMSGRQALRFIWLARPDAQTSRRGKLVMTLFSQGE
jgi:hypothetical protein